MQQLTRLLLLAALLAGGLVGCGQKSEDGPVPKPGGKRMTLEEAEKLRPKKKGSDN